MELILSGIQAYSAVHGYQRTTRVHSSTRLVIFLAPGLNYAITSFIKIQCLVFLVFVKLGAKLCDGLVIGS